MYYYEVVYVHVLISSGICTCTNIEWYTCSVLISSGICTSSSCTNMKWYMYMY